VRKRFFGRKIIGLILVFLTVYAGTAWGQEVARPDKATAVQTLAVETERALVPIGTSLDQLGIALKATTSADKAKLAVAANRTQTCPSSRLPRNLNRSRQLELQSLQNQVADLLRSGSQSKFEQVARDVADHALATEEIGVVCGVMYRAIAPAEARTLELAQRLQSNLDRQQQLRETIIEIEAVIIDDFWARDVTYRDDTGVMLSKTLESKEDAWHVVWSLQGALGVLVERAQMLQMQLQNAMNKQQQAMQLLSAIMKNQHETLKQIIQNMR